ncbi:MAG: hypothetical protein EA389_07880 [Ilumatobacter sp.]|nr:MAG: hypothetical protein EA389_07880 [Ilumatobacter sp.]
MYCTNSCRQKAYRARRELRRHHRPEPGSKLTRASSRDLSHGLRPAPDVVAGLADAAGRELTMCGTFARRARRPLWTHTDFVTGLEWSCRTCTDLGP